MLDQEIGDDWEPEQQAQWRDNQAAIRMQLLAEHGTVNGERKIADYRLMGPAPWSIAFEHNPLLAQIRSALAQGDHYPALVGACGLGERILNHLILTLREDYETHPATTRRVRRDDTFTNWDACIEVLHGWGVLTDSVATQYRQLKTLRPQSVHFNPAVAAGQREPALAALRLIQDIIGDVFNPLGGLLPRSALLSPAHRFYPRQTADGAEWEIVDDAEYDPAPLSDEQFAAALPAGVMAMHPELNAGA